MTRILVESGCFGDFTHHQRLDALDSGFPVLNSEMPDYNLAEIMEESRPYEFAVIRRSYPHGSGFADAVALRQSLAGHGFALDTALWMFRNPEANAKSMHKQGHVASVEDASNSINEAIGKIPSIFCAHLDTYAVEFGSLSSIDYVTKLFARMNLPLKPKNDFVFDADAKHFQ